MILVIQHAYYLHARNPSDDDTLIDLADEMGLDRERFANELHSRETRNALMEEITLGQRMGAHGFPSLVLESGGAYQVLPYDYLDPRVVLKQLT